MRKRILAGILSILLVLTGCSGASDPDQKKDSDEKTDYQEILRQNYIRRLEIQDPLGESLKIGLVGRPKNMNPLKAEDASSKILIRALYEKLFDVEEKGGDFSIKPRLADLTISDDRKTYTINIREGASWNDGRPVTSDDLIYTLDKIKKGDTVYGDILNVEGAEASFDKTGEKQVTIRLNGRSNNFCYDLADILVLPSHKREIFDKDQVDLNEDLVGNSAYEFSSRTVEMDEKQDDILYDETVLKANEKAGNPRFKELQFIVVKHPQSSRTALYNGEVQVGPIPVTEANGVKGSIYKVYSMDTNECQALLFNLNSKAVQDEEVREAILKAVTPQTFAGNFGPPAYVGLADSIFGEDNNYRTREVLFHDSDPEAAQRAFAKKIDENEDFALKYAFIAETGEAQEKIAISLEEGFTQLGVDFKTLPMFKDDFLSAVKSKDKDFDFCLVSVKGSRNPDYYRRFYTSSGIENYSGLRDQDLDLLFSQARQTESQEAMEDLYDQIQEKILDSKSLYPLVYTKSAFATDDRLKNVEEAGTDPDALIEDWEKLGWEDFQKDDKLIEEYDINMMNVTRDKNGIKKRLEEQRELTPIPKLAGEEDDERAE